MGAAIREDLAVQRVLFIQNERDPAILHDFNGILKQHLVGDAVGQTMRGGTVGHEVSHPFLVERFGGGKQRRDLFARPHEVLHVGAHR